MNGNGKQYAYVAGFQGTNVSKLHKCFFIAQCFNLPQKPAIAIAFVSGSLFFYSHLHIPKCHPVGSLMLYKLSLRC